MTMTANHKRLHDRARFHAELRRNPDLIKTSLRIIFRGDPKPGAGTGQKAASDKLRGHYKKSHMDSAILAQLVGLGYLRPDGANYRVTKLAFKLFDNKGDPCE